MASWKRVIHGVAMVCVVILGLMFFLVVLLLLGMLLKTIIVAILSSPSDSKTSLPITTDVSNKTIEAHLKNLEGLLDRLLLSVDPLLYSDPERQIGYKVKAVDGRLSFSPGCMEFQVEKPTVNVIECSTSKNAFMDTLLTFSRLGGVASFECIYTVQLTPSFIQSSAIWTNESCKAVMKNGEEYIEITQATFRGEVRTMDDQNFARVREDMGKWCKCLKKLDSSITGLSDKVDNGSYSSNDQDACLDFVRAKKDSRAFIKGKGVQGVCNPGKVMLSVIPWKDNSAE